MGNVLRSIVSASCQSLLFSILVNSNVACPLDRYVLNDAKVTDSYRAFASHVHGMQPHDARGVVQERATQRFPRPASPAKLHDARGVVQEHAKQRFPRPAGPATSPARPDQRPAPASYGWPTRTHVSTYGRRFIGYSSVFVYLSPFAFTVHNLANNKF